MRRFFIRNRLYSITNLVGLSIGIGCFILISLYVRSELSYDDYNKNAGRILLLQQFESNRGSGGKLAADLKHYFEGIEQTVRLKNTSPLITYGENASFEPNFYFADSTVFSIFTFPLVQGNAYTALKENYGVVISEKVAEKYFPHQKWLQDFAYRMDIHWWVFALTAGIVVVIAALTVGVQTVKAAIASPVKVLKAE